MSADKATPRKWSWELAEYTGHVGVERYSTVTYDITTDGGKAIFRQTVENTEQGHVEGNERVELIVRAVNAHQGLVDALKAIESELAQIRGRIRFTASRLEDEGGHAVEIRDLNDTAQQCLNGYASVVAALARAEGSHV